MILHKNMIHYYNDTNERELYMILHKNMIQYYNDTNEIES